MNFKNAQIGDIVVNTSPINLMGDKQIKADTLMVITEINDSRMDSRMSYACLRNLATRKTYCVADTDFKVLKQCNVKDFTVVQQQEEQRKFKVNDVLKFNCQWKITVYTNNKSKGAVNVIFTENSLLVVRSINEDYYNCTVINGEYKGSSVKILHDSAENVLDRVGDIINDNFGDDKEMKVTKTNAQSVRKFKFKSGDDIIYVKSYVREQQDFMGDIGERCTFVSYLGTPVYDKRATGIPLDCVVKDSLQRSVLANSHCFELYKKNKPYVKHNITVKVSGNRVKYMDELGDGKIAVGMSVCDKQDKFNLKTGLLLAMARAYNDKALQDYVFDMAKD